MYEDRQLPVSCFQAPIAMQSAPDIFSYRKYWAKKFCPAPFLPMSRVEMEQLHWDSCDIILVSGDAYVDHPSFGMAVIGRVLEAGYTGLFPTGPAESIFWRERRQHGFHGQSLYLGS